ncbi:MAG TPA: ROK family protein [Burkholderiaceae bacterium]|jgi:fructokinase|nr:ROK family protein [Burkholderiaceae bacterium]
MVSTTSTNPAQDVTASPALGIDLGGTKIEAALLGPDGSATWRERVPTPKSSYDDTIRAIVGLVQAAREASGTRFTVGIGTPGSVTAAGLIKNANSTCLNGHPMQRDLEAELGQRVVVANDANCLALSEATDGAGAGAEVVFAVILGTGAGAGVAVRGHVLQGPNGVAGEWGHNPLPWATPSELPGPLCNCGRHGCIETWVSGTALGQDHARVVGEVLSAETISQRASAGDPDCVATLDRHAHRLARSLASIINVLDPDVIVLAGGLSKLDHLAQRVPRLWADFVYGARFDPPVRTRLLTARHGDASGVRGAAWLGRHAG